MIKVGIVGLGVMGKNHLRVLQGIPQAQIVGLCDPIAQGDLGFELFKDIDSMLTNVELDAVIIATPTSLHKDMAIACMKKGISCLIEKPVAPSVAEAKEILEFAQKTKARVCVGHVERFNPVVSELKKSLADKEIYHIGITRVGPIPPRITDVGVLSDLSVHDIDIIRYVTNKEILRKNIFCSQKIHNNHEDTAILSFEIEGDIIASITTSWLTPFKKRCIEIATKDVYFEADLMNQTLREYSSFVATNRLNSYALSDIFIKKQEPLQAQLEAFLHYVVSDNISSLASIEDSMKTLEISSSEAK